MRVKKAVVLAELGCDGGDHQGSGAASAQQMACRANSGSAGDRRCAKRRPRSRSDSDSDRLRAARNPDRRVDTAAGDLKMANPPKDRLAVLAESTTLNGIDFVEIAAPDQKTLRVHFVNQVALAGTVTGVSVSGGETI